VPNLESFISDRQSLQAAESRGSGVSWATSEDARQSPPPVSLDPDAPFGSQVGFWKNVLKPNSAA